MMDNTTWDMTWEASLDGWSGKVTFEISDKKEGHEGQGTSCLGQLMPLLV